MDKQIARILRETAQLLEIDGAIIGQFPAVTKRRRNCRRPARIHRATREGTGKAQRTTGNRRPHGRASAGNREDGYYSLRKELLKKYPATILNLLQLQSLGPKKVAFLWSNFKAGTVADVERIAKEGKLRDLPGFGERANKTFSRQWKSSKNPADDFTSILPKPLRPRLFYTSKSPACRSYFLFRS